MLITFNVVPALRLLLVQIHIYLFVHYEFYLMKVLGPKLC